MAMRYIRPETMIMISNQWLTELRSLLEALPLTAPLVPLIERIHAELLAKQSLRSALDAQLAVLQDRMTLLDLLHDRKMRGTYLILSGLAEAANDPAQAAVILTLRDHLFPEGLLAINRSYVEQAGDAHRLPARLDPAQQEMLSTLATPDGTLAQYVAQWRTAALELAQLDDERATLLEQRTRGEGATTPEQAREATLQWMRVAQTVENSLLLDPTATDDVRARILAPLQRAELQARRRRNRAGTPDAEQPTDGDQPIPADPAPGDVVAPDQPSV
jgi:hypothetical protein